jgi:Protein of unknown function (DUF2924)
MWVVANDHPQERSNMDRDLQREVEALRCASIADVRAKYRELFREEPRTKHRESLFRQVAWRMQALAEGGLSERARQRALAIAKDADLRVLAPRANNRAGEGLTADNGRNDPRIPPPGAVLTRDYDGAAITVRVLADGFEHEGKRFSSLSAIATQVTGTRWNGLAFFGLTARKPKKERVCGR